MKEWLILIASLVSLSSNLIGLYVMIQNAKKVKELEEKEKTVSADTENGQ